MIKGVLTIIFDEPFYKAIFEQFDGTEYKVAKLIWEHHCQRCQK